MDTITYYINLVDLWQDHLRKCSDFSYTYGSYQWPHCATKQRCIEVNYDNLKKGQLRDYKCLYIWRPNLW